MMTERLSILDAEMFRSLQMLLNEYMCYVTEMVQTELIELQYYHMMRGHASKQTVDCPPTVVTSLSSP